VRERGREGERERYDRCAEAATQQEGARGEKERERTSATERGRV